MWLAAALLSSFRSTFIILVASSIILTTVCLRVLNPGVGFHTSESSDSHWALVPGCAKNLNAWVSEKHIKNITCYFIILGKYCYEFLFLLSSLSCYHHYRHCLVMAVLFLLSFPYLLTHRPLISEMTYYESLPLWLTILIFYKYYQLLLCNSS